MPHIGNFPIVYYPKPYRILPPDFFPYSDVYDWKLTERSLDNRASLEPQSFYAPVRLPQGATMEKLKLIGFRDDPASTLDLWLMRKAPGQSGVVIATVNADWTTGYGTGEDDTITSPVIDNEQYDYSLHIQIDPNDSISDCYFYGAEIPWK